MSAQKWRYRLGEEFGNRAPFRGRARGFFAHAEELTINIVHGSANFCGDVVFTMTLP